MRLFVEQEPEVGSAGPRTWDRVLVARENRDEVLATVLWRNPLKDDCSLDDTWPGRRVLSWSGTLGEHLFERHPATWLAPGHGALDRWCDGIAPALEAGGFTWCFAPHSRHVLSDVQSCVRFLDEHASEPFEIAFAPASLLEPGMLDALEDHLQRGFDALAERCSLVILEDLTPVDGGHSLRAVPLGDGVLPAATMRRVVERLLPPRMPLVLRGGAVDRQLEWLGL